MKLNITKNFIITFFVILAIYQTSELWFEGFSNHNFFYSFFNNSQNSSDDGLLYSLDSIILTSGGDRLICVKNDIYKSESKAVFDNAVKITMEEGVLTSQSVFDWNTILSGRSVIYQYKCGIMKSDIAKMFGFDEGLLASVSSDIDTVVIIPYTTTTPEKITVGFGNMAQQKACFYTLEKNQYTYNLYDAIDLFSSSGDIYYTSSVRSGLDLFNGNKFLPQWSGYGFEYHPIKIVNPFVENGEVEQIKIERAADAFFDNPVSKWSSVSGGVYTYSDENSVVKYYDNGVMEYYNYSTDKGNSVNDFYTSYLSAISLLKKDFNIQNEFYLSGYNIDREKTVFYFDYKINNFSVFLDSETRKNTGMKSVIEVAVSGGRVSRYRRFARNFVVDNLKKENVQKDFVKAVDEVFTDIQNSGKNQNGVDDIELCYYVGEDEGNLCWIIDVGDKKFVKET